MRFLLIAVAMCATGCSPSVQCDKDGFIIDINDQPESLQPLLRRRNADLQMRRTKALFEDGDATALTSKAEGCD